MAGSDAAAVSDASPAAATVGRMLAAARTAQGLTLEQVSTDLRIEARQLAALEADDFARIGVPVFVKGYIKQYGQRLGLNQSDLLAQYYRQAETPPVEIKPNRTIRLRDTRQITVWMVAAIVLILVVGGLAAWWYFEPTLDFSSLTQ